jgi:hypothetical protein
MVALRSVGLVDDWDVNHSREVMRIRVDLETIEAHVLDCKACSDFLAANPLSDWMRFWRVTSCLHCHLAERSSACTEAARAVAKIDATEATRIHSSAIGSRGYHSDCMMMEAASDLGFLLS